MEISAPISIEIARMSSRSSMTTSIPGGVALNRCLLPTP
jgi:hypothetical protein